MDGQVRAGDRVVPLGQAAAAGELTAEDTIEFAELSRQYQQSTFAGHFVEVAVDAAIGETRMGLSGISCAAGRLHAVRPWLG